MLQSLSERRAGASLSPALVICAAAFLLVWPVLYNGYPLVFGDTASYLDTIDPRKAHWARPVFYTLFILPLHGRASLWPVPFAQALIVAHLTYVTVRVVCGSVRVGSYLALVTVLAFGSSLPWFASFVMPDVLTGVVVLGLYLLAFAGDRLGRVERVYVFVLTAGAIACHQSHLPLAAGLVVVIFVLLRLVSAPRPRMATALVVVGPLALAIAAHLSANAFAQHGLTLSPGSSIILLARMIGDGTATRYLRETCPQRRFVLCNYLDELPEKGDAFLQDDTRIFERAGGQAIRSEAHEIVLGTLQARPREEVVRGAVNAARQFFAFRADDWLLLDDPIGPFLQRAFPFDYPAYANSRQATHTLPLATLTAWHTFSALFGMAVSGLMFIEYWRRGDREMIALFVVVLAALLGNAVITGTLAAVDGRYQSRIAWLFVLYAALATYHFYLCSAAEARREG